MSLLDYGNMQLRLCLCDWVASPLATFPNKCEQPEQLRRLRESRAFLRLGATAH